MNKVELSGRIARDLELRYTTNNSAVLDFPLAVKRTKEVTDFISVVAYNKSAELIYQYCKKGSSIIVIGKITTRNYEDKDGKKVYITEVNVEEVEFISGGKGDKKKDGGQKPITNEDLPF